MTSQELLVKLYDRIMEGTATQYRETIMPLQILLGNGADLAAQHPLTRTPLAFLLPEITDWLPQEITSLLENEAGYLKLVNKEGLTLLQAEQKKQLETQRSNGLSCTLVKLCQKAGLDYKTESYIPFIEYFGPLEHLPYNAQEFLNAPESLAWIQSCQQVTSGTVADLINTCPYPELLTCFESKLSAFGLPEIYTKRSELENERNQWMVDTKGLLSDKPQLTQHLLNALSVNLRNVLYLLLNESYVDILPSVLERIYPTRKDFLVEKQTKVENGIYCSHPIMYIMYEKECKNVVECLLNFLGEEYIPQFLSNLQEYDMYSLLAHFPESKLLDLYESTPSLFIQVTEKKDAFKQMLQQQDIPLSLKRKIAMEHIERLKIIENCGTGFPYVWHIFFSGGNHIPLMKELIEQDSSLLYLKSIEGFTIQQLLSSFPKIPEVIALQRVFSNSANIDTISGYLPDHKIVYSFREIWEELSNKTIHLWSDIDEVMIYDKHFWRYDSLKSFIPRESYSLLGEYDHELLDEDAPEIFKTILKNDGRICGLTARPPESSKFESTYRRLSQSGLAFDGTQGMETVFTKEKFSHFDRDIFYCGDRDKGEVVLEAIDALYGEVISDNLPLFVFTDDLMENLIAISETLKDTRYKFVLYHFRGIDHKLAPYMQNPDLVRSAFQEFRLAKQNIIGS